MSNPNIATIGSRIGGAFVDWFIISILSIPVFYILTIVLDANLTKFAAINGYEKGYQVLGFMGWMITDVIYSVVLQSSNSQSTFGQRAFGIRLAKLDGGKVNALTALIRSLASYLSSAFLKIGYLIALFNKDKQTLHDYIANTIVIKTHSDATISLPATSQSTNSKLKLVLLGFIGFVVLAWIWNTYTPSSSLKNYSQSSNNPQINKSEWVLFDTDKVGKHMLPIKSFYDIGTVKKLSNTNYIITIANVFDNPVNIRNDVTNEIMNNVKYEKRVIEINCSNSQSRLLDAQLYGTSLSDVTQIRLSNMPKVENDKFEASYVASKICPTLIRLN